MLWLINIVNNNNKPVVMEEAPNTMALGAVATGNIKAYEDVTAAKKKVNKNINITKCKQIIAE